MQGENVTFERQESIHEKGFNMIGQSPAIDYSKIKVGVKSVEDAVLNLGSLKAASSNKSYSNKQTILRALADKDIPIIREISNYFYDTSGIYKKLCDYLATLYKYDWYIVPEIFDSAVKEERVLKDFVKILSYLDNSHIKKMCGDIALEVIKNGAYYGYMVPSADEIILQQLPCNYCRTRYNIGNAPAVEFNMKFFDDKFKDPAYRMSVLKMFPDEFAKGYLLYKQGRLVGEEGARSAGGWYLLNPDNSIKFSLSSDDSPILINATTALLDLDAAQDLDRRKQMQQLLKIVIQKLPMDKNGDLIFDIDEARDIHNNAVEMLRRAIGVDVLTTFADIDVANMSDKNTTATQDDLQKVERAVFNSIGISQNLFNTDGNLSLEKSCLNDEAAMRSLLYQFNAFFDKLCQKVNPNKKKYNFRLHILGTTIYNYKDLSKLYREQVTVGYSKMLPQIALGHSQSSIINAAYFENSVLKLTEIMIPPLMSSTLSGQDILGKSDKNNTSKTQVNSEGQSKSDSGAGRPQKSDDEKSTKTIQNEESMR